MSDSACKPEFSTLNSVDEQASARLIRDSFDGAGAMPPLPGVDFFVFYFEKGLDIAKIMSILTHL